MNNPLSTLSFVRKLGLGKEKSVTEVYTPKLFYDIISRLKSEHLTDVNKPQIISLKINIKEFLNSTETGNSKNLYKHVIDCINSLQATQVKWVENGCDIGVAVISYYNHDPKSGEVEVQVHGELVRKILELTNSEHFSFLKKYLFKLTNAQSIKLFPYFMSWRNKGMVQMPLELFKQKLGYNTAGYKFFNNLKLRVLEPAITEINDKTNLHVSYKLLGENLTGKRQRVTGLQFFIVEKAQQNTLSSGIETADFEEVQPPKPTVSKPVKPIEKIEKIEKKVENPYMIDILRVFYVFEPESTPDNIAVFLTYFEDSKAVLEACLYAEQEHNKGHLIKNFRGYLVTGIPRGLGSGILEQREKAQKQAQQVAQKKKNEVEKAAELDTLLKEAEILRGGYKTDINGIMRKTATEYDKDVVADILRAKSSIYAGKTLEDFRSNMYISTYIKTFIETYPERFAEVQRQYKKAFDGLATKIKKLDTAKGKDLFYY
jgi:plasmid replication initiation protein